MEVVDEYGLLGIPVRLVTAFCVTVPVTVDREVGFGKGRRGAARYEVNLFSSFIKMIHYLSSYIGRQHDTHTKLNGVYNKLVAIHLS